MVGSTRRSVRIAAQSLPDPHLRGGGGAAPEPLDIDERGPTDLTGEGLMEFGKCRPRRDVYDSKRNLCRVDARQKDRFRGGTEASHWAAGIYTEGLRCRP